MYKKIRKWFEQGLWTADMVKRAVEKEVITQDECEKIIGHTEEK